MTQSELRNRLKNGMKKLRERMSEFRNDSTIEHKRFWWAKVQRKLVACTETMQALRVLPDEPVPEEHLADLKLKTNKQRAFQVRNQIDEILAELDPYAPYFLDIPFDYRSSDIKP